MPISDTQSGNDSGREISEEFDIDVGDVQSADGDRPPSPGPEELDLDEVLELLGTQRRRLVLSYMAQTRGAVDAPDIVDYVHEREREPSTWKATYVALHQVHLPTLDEADILVYDEENRTVYLGENGEAVLAVLLSIMDVWSAADSGAPSESDGEGDDDTLRQKLTDWLDE